MLMSQLDRLPTMHQMFLKVASVLGVTFEKETLRAVYPIEEGIGLINVRNFTSVALPSQLNFKFPVVNKSTPERWIN